MDTPQKTALRAAERVVFMSSAREWQNRVLIGWIGVLIAALKLFTQSTLLFWMGDYVKKEVDIILNLKVKAPIPRYPGLPDVAGFIVLFGL
jgi:hypothetical protein